MIRLDHLVATSLDPAVREAMAPWMDRGEFGLPAAGHQPGMAAAEALERARGQVAELVGCRAEEVVFTSSGTEAANAALCGWAWRHPEDPLWVSAADHPAVLETARFLTRFGHELNVLPVDGAGRLDPEVVRRRVRGGLLAVHLGNHDSGMLQPVAELVVAAREGGAEVFCDGSTSGGWVRWPGGQGAPGLASLSPHRFHGPAGTGVLVVRAGLEVEPLLHGGRQERGRRAGTENLPGWVGAGRACRLMTEEGGMRAQRVARLRDRLWERLREWVPEIVLHGPPPGPGRDPRHLAVGMAGVEGEALMRLLDLRGVCVTAASGCLSGAEKYSAALRAMGVEESWVRGTVLLAPGWEQSLETMDEAAGRLARAVEKIRSM